MSPAMRFGTLHMIAGKAASIRQLQADLQPLLAERPQIQQEPMRGLDIRIPERPDAPAMDLQGLFLFSGAGPQPVDTEIARIAEAIRPADDSFVYQQDPSAADLLADSRGNFWRAALKATEEAFLAACRAFRTKSGSP